MIQKLTARRRSISKSRIALLLLISACAAQFGAGQGGPKSAPVSRVEVGRPFIRNYSPREYQAHGQNWSIVQDQRGVMYFGNSVGILEYDGSSWRLIRLPKDNLGRSMAIDKDDRVYIGSADDLGYIAPDATGLNQFVSLVDKVPAGERGFGDINKTSITSQGVYFQSPTHLLRWANDQIRVWKPATPFLGSGVVRDQLYAVLKDVGLTRFDGETFVPVPGGTVLGDKGGAGIVPLDESRILIGTRRQGFFIFDGSSVKQFPTALDDFLRESGLYQTRRLEDGTFALALIQGGLAIMDQQGKLVIQVDKGSGLPSNSVYYVYADKQGALWAGTERGISRVETPSPISILGESSGIDGTVYDICRFQGTLYLTTNVGVFYLKSPGASDAAPISKPGGKPEAARIQRVPGFAGNAWTLLPIEGPSPGDAPSLLVAASEGVAEIARDHVTVIAPSVLGSFRSLALHQYRPDPTRLFVSLVDGFASLRRDGKKWVNEGRIANISDAIWSIAEDKDGRIWLGTSTTGLILLEFPSSSQNGKLVFDYAHPKLTRFGIANGLPDSTIKSMEVGGEPFFATSDGLYRLDQSRKSFVKDTVFNKVGVTGDPNEHVLREDKKGNVWIHFGRESAVALRQPDGSYVVEKRPFLRIADLNVVGILPEEDGVVWFGGADGLIRYDSNLQKDYSADFEAMIRRVVVGDKTIFAGTTNATSKVSALRLPYSENSLRFEFAAPSFDDERANQFQHLLEGFEKDWSDWSREAGKDYTNLPFGDYQFRLKAKNLYGHVSKEAIYTFSVLAPWYRTWWAYLSYVALLGLGVFAVDRFQRYRLIGRERERAQFREAQFRAEAAEALAKSESERKKNVELLSEIGKEITASLDFDTIFVKLYEHVNQLADAAIFGVGLYSAEKHAIEYRLAIENGKRYAPYSRDTTDKNQFPVWCIENRQPVFINDVTKEYGRYLEKYEEPSRLLEDGSHSRAPRSIICLPLATKEKVLGIITIQSFEKNAYTDFHLNLLQNLAAYTSIALDNAAAYKQLNEQESEIRQRAAELSTINSVSQALASKLEVDAVIKLVGEKVRQVFGAQIAFVALLDKPTNTINFVYGYGDNFSPQPYGKGMVS
ncbi:MAG: two-component regulator propeller domain-containing protein, partial [Acidobacteriota bacterium]